MPAERLRRLSLSAALQLNPDQLQLSDVDAVLDSSHLVGAATVLLQERPAFGASMAIDRLNLDAYLPQSEATKPAAAAAPVWDEAAPRTSSFAAPASGAALHSTWLAMERGSWWPTSMMTAGRKRPRR